MVTSKRPSVVVAGVVSAVAAVTATGTAGTALAGPGPSTGRGDPAVVERLTVQAGLQLGPKHTDRPVVTVRGRRYLAPDPALAQLPAGTRTDQFYWRNHRQAVGTARMRARTAGTPGARERAVPTPFTHREQEPMGHRGRNDGSATSERLTGLGVDARFQAARVQGRLSAPPVAARRASTREDQGSIPRATRTGLGRAHPRVVVHSRIGDGPHGRAGDGHGDFDFFRVHALAGSSITVDTRGSRVDTVLAVYSAAGRILAASDDVGEGDLTSAVQHHVRRTGSYYVMVGGFSLYGSVPANPFRSGSGRRAGDEGTYRLRVTVRPVDRDVYGVRLRSGDVLAGVLTGRARTAQVLRVDGHGMVATQQDLSAAYPLESPLPGGGATFAYVAEEPGWYAVAVQDGAGNYRLLLETYPPGTTGAGEQTIFLDFDGARVNTGMFGGRGVVTLSPLSGFLSRWRLPKAAESAVVDATVAGVKENLDASLREHGLNRALRVRVLNSRDHADPFGRPDVSRVVVGGSIGQSGVPTIGIAQSVDPGNFAHEESAIVLLDEISRPAGPRHSVNTYLRGGSNRVAFVGQVLGNLVAHETGHLVGSFHTQNRDARVNLMDAGGAGFARLYGTGPDRVGGTRDDTDTDFGEDVFAPEEGFRGLADTLNTTAWAFAGS